MESYAAAYRQIEEVRTAYLDDLPPPDPDWPPDVRVVYADLHAHLFDPGLRIQDVRARCGIGDHNISSRFLYFVGSRPKDYLLYHRMELAKQLLRLDGPSIALVALAVGYESPNAFSQIFKRRVGCLPSVYRKRPEEREE